MTLFLWQPCLLLVERVGGRGLVVPERVQVGHYKCATITLSLADCRNTGERDRTDSNIHVIASGHVAPYQ